MTEPLREKVTKFPLTELTTFYINYVLFMSLIDLFKSF